jgi:hypothetical protein
MSKKKRKPPIKLKTQVGASIDFATQKVVSYSQYSTYKQCPHKWYVQNVKKVKQSPSINMVFGSAIHNTIQHYLKVMYLTSGANADRENLEEIFESNFKNEFKIQLEANKNIHFTTPEEMSEFFDDGISILTYFKKHRNLFFSTRGSYLIGVEIPIQKEIQPGVIFKGSIDIVIYDSDLDKILIYDLKTSTKGWNDYHKKDFTKSAQIILYKLYFAELYEFPVDKINVEFLILKRKAEPTEWQVVPKRIQSFKPANGKGKMNEANSSFIDFINDCFEDGKPRDKEYTKNITKLCEWCPFNNTSNCQKEGTI